MERIKEDTPKQLMMLAQLLDGGGEIMVTNNVRRF